MSASTALAAGLAARGVSKGDRVAILMTNRPEFVETALGANAIGAIAVPLNFRLAPDEVAFILGHSGAKVVVTDSLLQPLATAAVAASEDAPLIVVSGVDGAGDSVDGGGADATISYDALLGDRTDAPDVEIGERDVAMIMYTSGTTGRPKGAMLTHLNLLMQSVTAIRTSRLQGEDVASLCNVPLFHIAGIGGMPSSLMIGARTVIMPTGLFDAESTLDIVESEKITTLFLVPAQWQVMCAHPGRHSSLRVASHHRVGCRAGVGQPARRHGARLPALRDHFRLRPDRDVAGDDLPTGGGRGPQDRLGRQGDPDDRGSGRQ